MLKFYGRKTSINVQKAACAMGEAGLKWDWIDKDGIVGSIDSREYRKLNPASQIPTLEDDGLLVRQSNAIVRYISKKYAPTKLWPSKYSVYVEAERWMEWQATDNLKNMVTVFWGLIRTPPEKQNKDVIANAVWDLNKDFAFLNEHLAGRRYIAGNTFSMGDIPAGAAAYRFYALPIKRHHFPHLETWYQLLQERTPFRELVMVPLA